MQSLGHEAAAWSRKWARGHNIKPGDHVIFSCRSAATASNARWAAPSSATAHLAPWACSTALSPQPNGQDSYQMARSAPSPSRCGARRDVGAHPQGDAVPQAASGLLCAHRRRRGHRCAHVSGASCSFHRLRRSGQVGQRDEPAGRIIVAATCSTAGSPTPRFGATTPSTPRARTWWSGCAS